MRTILFIGQLVLASWPVVCFAFRRSVGLSVRSKCGQTVTDRPIVTMVDYWEAIGWELNATFTFDGLTLDDLEIKH